LGGTKLIWQIFPPFLAVVVIALSAVTWHSAGLLKNLYFEHTREMLVARCGMVEASVTGMLASGALDGVEGQCKLLGKASGTRITVILPDGRVAGDSDQSPVATDNYLSQPDVSEAMARGVGALQTRSETLGPDMIYVSRTVMRDGQVIGVIRTSLPMNSLERALKRMYLNMLAAGALVTAMAAGASLWISAMIGRPVSAMREAATAFAAGDFSRHAEVPESSELAALADAMNGMAGQLRDKIETVTIEKNELAAVLTGMVEGVLAVDAEGRILSINRAAAEFLGVDAAGARGRMVEEVARNPELQDFVTRTLKGQEPEETGISLTDGDGRSFQLHGSSLPGRGGISGAVIVLNDVTKLRRLENMRRDFVANVSHELRTPVTSIKGFVETLQEQVSADPQETKKFLDIIARHTDRLNAIIEDLLSLSRIEEDSDRGRIATARENIRKVLEAAVELSTAKAKAKQMKIELICDGAIESEINGLLLEQAVVNLIDNAVKYSNAGSTVTVEAGKTDNDIEISVRDEGCGITAEHLPRIFERFYVVDKARSRKLGGTGLGLAIVKHIVQSHRGSVDVASEAGKGSIFTIRLPQKQS
jgi:two-component system phosphate regulon sensor histidine kinase PhoR